MFSYSFGPQDWLLMLAMMSVMTVLTVDAVVGALRKPTRAPAPQRLLDDATPEARSQARSTDSASSSCNGRKPKGLGAAMRQKRGQRVASAGQEDPTAYRVARRTTKVVIDSTITAMTV